MPPSLLLLLAFFRPGKRQPVPPPAVRPVRPSSRHRTDAQTRQDKRPAPEEPHIYFRRRLASLTTACARLPSLVRRRSTGSTASSTRGSPDRSPEPELEEDGGHPLRKNGSSLLLEERTPPYVVWESDGPHVLKVRLCPTLGRLGLP